MKLPHFTIRELFLITVIVAQGVVLFYKRMDENHVLDLSYTEVGRILKKIEPDSKLLNGSGGNNKTEMEILVPSKTADQFVTKFNQEVYQAFDKGGWQQIGSSTSGYGVLLSDFGYELVQGSNTCLIDFTLVDRKKADEDMNKAYGGDYDVIRFLFVNFQAR